LAKTQEITILRGSALSNFQIAQPALIFAILISILTYYVTACLAPSFFTQLKNKIFTLRNSYTIEAIEENSFNKLNNKTTIYLGNKIGNNAFKNILIFDETDKSKIFIAKFGELKPLDKSVQLLLKHGTIQEFDKNNYLTSLNFEDFVLKVDLYTTTERYSKDISEYSITDLLNSNKPKFVAEGHQRIIWPSYSFLLVFFTLSIFLYKPRNTFADKVKLTLYTLTAVFTYFALSALTTRNPSAVYLPYLWSALIFLFSINRYS
jgi:lipopolysaccharide export LptBFGC system permease protein LptF